MSLDDSVEGLIKEENAQAEAVKSLINVKKKVLNELGSDIELKTDLSPENVVIHTGVDMLNRILSTKDFDKVIITEDLVQIKERKLLSLNRQSRREIVEIARNPDMQMNDFGNQQESFVKRMFTPRKKPQQ